MPIVTLTTDFGRRDNFAGVLHGVLATLAPRVRVVDLTHDVAPGDLAAGAFALLTAAPYFPRGTVHLAVVDPGVGTARRPVALKADGRWYVGPDNGVLSWAAPDPQLALELTAHRRAGARVSRTFHGRDVFAPAAAALARGRPPRLLGAPVRGLVRLPFPAARFGRGRWAGCCLLADRFGNMTTTVREAGCARWRGRALVAVAGGRRFPVREAYGDARPGAPVAVFGSAGFLELAARDADASRRFHLRRGMPVTVAPA